MSITVDAETATNDEPAAPARTGSSPPSTSTPVPSPTPTEPGPDDGRARVQDVLDDLRVKGRAPMTGYDRARFGQAWLDADRNGCDTRNDMLNTRLRTLEHKQGTGDCVVLSGTLHDEYTATTIQFVRGDGFLVDIDHVVALANAWVTGAFGWDVRKRAALANDPLNLEPVDASTNRQKGAGDAATWLPPNRAYRCAYVARQVAVKDKYGLWVTRAEQAAVARVLTTCPDERVPEDSGAATSVTQNLEDPYEEAPRASPAPEADGSTHYENCDAVRAAGAAPIRRGQPGYGPHLDREGDGFGCE